jgi:hypothetical protein
MGKKSRTKHQASALAAKKKRAAPDDYFRKGAFEMARFGKHVVIRNNMTPEQHEQFMKHCADRLPAVTAEIDEHVSAIAEIVASYDPLTILQHSYMVCVFPFIVPSTERDGESETGQRLVDYVQSMIAAVPPKTPDAPAISEESWGELSQHVDALFETFNRSYSISRSADWKVNGGGPSEEQEEFYVRALGMWCNVTGHRYHFQEIDYLRELISPHSEVFQRLWGIDAEGMLRGFGGILHALTRGLGEAIERFAEGEAAVHKAKTEGGDAAAEAALESLHGDDSFKDAFRRLFGAELFRIDQYLPKALLEDLSWAPGECLGFIDQNPQSGWPTRIWPRTKRPFLRVKGSYYCFDVHTLFDHIYRVLERTVRAKEPGYAQTWNDRQKEVSEDLPFKLLGKLLPGAKSWRPVYYETDELDAHGRRKWCELDGLVTYDDHLFIVEVKGGTFTAASPEGNFESHLKSIERLIFAPVDQGTRFLRWLEQQGVVDLCDEQHRTIGHLARKDFAHVTICAVSLDPFTELSAKAYHLQKLVGHTGTRVFWALSVSDLLTYTDLFDNPLVFLHFVEKRNQATASSKVILDDELDHYGMYLQHNNYDRHAEEVAGDSRINWTGYRKVIDDYFDARTRGEPATLPRQEIPPLYWMIIQELAKSRHVHRREVVSLLLDCASEMKAKTERSLVEALRLQANTRQPRPLAIAGKEVRITLVCWQAGAVMPGDYDAAGHCKASMLAAREPDRWMIELHFDLEQRLWRVEPTFFCVERLSEAEKSGLAARAEMLRTQRMDQAVEHNGKIGRNQLCTCGSGKKYKRCCGA